MKDLEALDFFRDDALVADPYPYFEALRGKCPVQREPHHGVMMVTGYDEALQVYNDTDTFSSCVSVTGPFPGFPVPLEGDDVSELQTQLLELGYDIVRADGVFGARTADGLRNFQRDYGLVADAICGPATLREADSAWAQAFFAEPWPPGMEHPLSDLGKN